MFDYSREQYEAGRFVDRNRHLYPLTKEERIREDFSPDLPEVETSLDED